MNLKWFIRSQSIVTLAAGMIYPYYLLFLKNLGNSFSKYGLAFAVFTISSAAVSQWLAPRLDSHGIRILTWSSLGMMLAMLVFPWLESYAWVLALQLLMGVCNAMQKMSERLLIRRSYQEGRARGCNWDVSFLDICGVGLCCHHRRLCNRLVDDQRAVLC